MPPITPKKSSIFLVEDSGFDAELVRHGLAEADADAVLEVQTDVASAIQRLQDLSKEDRAPDLLLLDLDVAGRSGIEVLAEARRLPGMAQTPVIMLTGSEDDSDIEAARQAGATTYYLKPQDLDGFVSLAKEIKAFWIDRLSWLGAPDEPAVAQEGA